MSPVFVNKPLCSSLLSCQLSWLIACVVHIRQMPFSSLNLLLPTLPYPKLPMKLFLPCKRTIFTISSNPGVFCCLFGTVSGSGRHISHLLLYGGKKQICSIQGMCLTGLAAAEQNLTSQSFNATQFPKVQEHMQAIYFSAK